MSDMDLPDFVTPLASGLEGADVIDLRLDPEVAAEVYRRCRELAEHRAQALISARSYLVHGGTR